MLRFKLKESTPQSTDSHDSFKRGSLTRKRQSLRSQHSERQSHIQHKYVNVDVGTPTGIRIDLGDAESYSILHESKFSALFKVNPKEGDPEVLVVRWMDQSSKGSDKDDIAISNVRNKDIVPTYYGKKRLMHQGVYVSLGLRRYIEGVPLSAVIKHVSEEQLDHYKLQVSSIVRDLSLVTSTHFGSILDGSLSTTTVKGYISAHNMIEKLRNRKYASPRLLSKDGDWDKKCVPRLCHGSLWPEHIIVNGTEVKGIVGWSSADFLPEALDRYMYRMWYVPSQEEREWRDFLFYIPGTYEAVSAKAAQMDMIAYARAVSAVRVGTCLRGEVDELARDAIEEAATMYPFALSVNSAGRYGNSGDGASRSSLGHETEDTWENFTTTTETTIK